MRCSILDALAIREMDNPYAQVAESEADDANALPEKVSDAARLAGLKEDIDTALALGKPLFVQIHLMDTHGLKFYPSVQTILCGHGAKRLLDDALLSRLCCRI